MSKALIIEDNKDLGEVYLMTLQMLDYEAELIMDGKMALERLATAQPDLIILDMNLPQVSGHYIYKQIRADPQMDEVHVIIATANNVLATAMEDELGPNDQILLKPISPRQLQQIINAF